MRSRSSDNANLFEDMAMTVAFVSVFDVFYFCSQQPQESIELIAQSCEDKYGVVLTKV